MFPTFVCASFVACTTVPHLCGSLQSLLVNGSERAKVRPGVEVEVHPELYHVCRELENRLLAKFSGE